MRRLWTSVPLLIVLQILLTGCSTTDQQYHRLAVGDALAILPYDTFLIGVEKARSGYAGRPVTCGGSRTTNCVHLSAVDPALAAHVRELYTGQLRPTFVSHIAKFDGGNGTPCFIFNDYARGTPCPGVTLTSSRNGERVDPSWKALGNLTGFIDDYASKKSPSHIIVYSMGWNTKQDEALQNFRDLETQLVKASEGTDFRPLFIVITWPSTGSPTISGTDYGIKAKDADEVGLLWANQLINGTLRSVKRSTNIPLVVIGHSFGARLTSRAVFSSALVGAPDEPVVDLLIGLQGAYSFQRFLPDQGKEGSPYRDFPQQVGKVVLTSSTYDKAVKAVFHDEYFVGSSDVFERTKASTNAFEHRELPTDGSFVGSCSGGKILMLDASKFIKDGAGASGAHSDIYDAEIGRMTFALITSCVRRE